MAANDIGPRAPGAVSDAWINCDMATRRPVKLAHRTTPRVPSNEGASRKSRADASAAPDALTRYPQATSDKGGDKRCRLLELRDRRGTYPECASDYYDCYYPLDF